jgi:hypothetical protein
LDPTRQIRLLIAPFFFFVSIIFAYLSAGKALPLQNNMAALVGVVTLSTLPVGFLISSIVHIFLRALFRMFKSNFETHLSEEDINRIWPQLNTSLGRHTRSIISKTGIKKTPANVELCIAVTFDHGILYKNNRGVHEWIMRVYTAFMTSINSLVAILFSYIAVVFLRVSPPCVWWLCTGSIVILLFVGAWGARDTLFEIVEFQTHRTFEPKKDPSDSAD